MKYSPFLKFRNFAALLVTSVFLVFPSAYCIDCSIFVSAKDGEYKLKNQLRISEIKSVTTGDFPKVVEIESVSLNTVRVSLEGALVEMSFFEGDVLGPFRFRHVPSLPVPTEFKDLNSLAELSAKLGRPGIAYEDQGIWEWAFFSIDGNEIKIMYVTFSKNGSRIGLKFGEGKVKGDIVTK